MLLRGPMPRSTSPNVLGYAALGLPSLGPLATRVNPVGWTPDPRRNPRDPKKRSAAALPSFRGAAAARESGRPGGYFAAGAAAARLRGFAAGFLVGPAAFLRAVMLACSAVFESPA